MPITVKCESCGKTLEVKDELAGTTSKCPGCGAALRVPQDADLPSASEREPQGPGPAIELPEELELEEAPERPTRRSRAAPRRVRVRDVQASLVDPASIIEIRTVVRPGQPEPSMGRDGFVWEAYESTNPKMYKVLERKGLKDRIPNSFVVSDDEDDSTGFAVEQTEKGRSIVFQAQTVQFVSGSGPGGARIITVFRTPSGEDPLMDMTGEPIGVKVEGGCFVATACCGGPGDWRVLALQGYRDERLTRSRTGRRLTRAYYVLGPPLAGLLRHRRILRGIARMLLVQPLAEQARRLLQREPGTASAAGHASADSPF